MSQKSTQVMDEILGRAIRDPEFRAKLLESPEHALAGSELSPEDVALIVGGVTSESGAAFLHSFAKVSPIMWCTDKKCYESG